MLKFYSRFEISDETGDPLTDHDMTQIHYSRITSLQVGLFFFQWKIICSLYPKADNNEKWAFVIKETEVLGGEYSHGVSKCVSQNDRFFLGPIVASSPLKHSDYYILQLM
jgi:hypothetical protein